MKTFRRFMKLLPPAFVMRIWLSRRYGIKVKRSPWGGVAGFALAVLPYAFTAALSVRAESDCRLLKYFLPYGQMKKLVFLSYRMKVGNDAKDHGAVGVFRAVMPYGLVLWWDAEDRRMAERPCRPAASLKKGESVLLERGMGPLEQARADRMEALSLRYLITMAGRE